ncbi:uncharacterized protein [Henckelia pumila]|uniref:uncharacterized protein n=1 Tax=Henckelia pumila TaxID=405737 RepID=UPI003C6DD321
MDELTSKSELLTLARVCVELDLLKPRHDHIFIGLGDKIIDQRFIYESLPKYCTYCCHIGHGVDECFVNVRVPWPPSKAKNLADLRTVINEKRSKETFARVEENKLGSKEKGDNSDARRLVWKQVGSKKGKEKVGEGLDVRSPSLHDPSSSNGGNPRSLMPDQGLQKSNKFDPLMTYLSEEALVNKDHGVSGLVPNSLDVQQGEASDKFDPKVDNLANDRVLARDLDISQNILVPNRLDGLWQSSWVNGVFVQDCWDGLEEQHQSVQNGLAHQGVLEPAVNLDATGAEMVDQIGVDIELDQEVSDNVLVLYKGSHDALGEQEKSLEVSLNEEMPNNSEGGVIKCIKLLEYVPESVPDAVPDAVPEREKYTKRGQLDLRRELDRFLRLEIEL